MDGWNKLQSCYGTQEAAIRTESSSKLSGRPFVFLVKLSTFKRNVFRFQVLCGIKIGSFQLVDTKLLLTLNSNMF